MCVTEGENDGERNCKSRRQRQTVASLFIRQLVSGNAILKCFSHIRTENRAEQKRTDQKGTVQNKTKFHLMPFEGLDGQNSKI
jgi:hypothetical protein